ncbi:GSCFA domain-containing protein [Chitinophaga silvatica]|uniref:GSCFA domain-containing protein n=1 Tax=Chitinophaga silvatica TaxID=2282649 RepID=A0A3E1Y683_9BACT|nr:GSCFA domain-containing protein [Chitinophaga silvatica]RFS20445.1 GSCFA domain-containing protein [Chitinophaga silvatica]
MQFHLSFPISPLVPGIQHNQQLMLMGSCFAEEVGAQLTDHRFNTIINPNGILFNPLSITRALTSYLDGKLYTESDLFQHQDIWHSWQHHSRFSGLSKEAVLQQINQSQTTAIKAVEKLDWLIITLGSAHAYTLKENSQIVGNCHKVPASNFDKRLLTVEEIVTSLDNVMHRLFFRNRKVNILYTVSPVRYVRDGVVENNLSKAILLQAVHHLVNKFNRLYYFPAYELVIDDLRDYRFYKEDLVHPNEQAIQYVWEHVTKYCISPDSQELIKEIAEIRKAAAHKPFNPESEKHILFLKRYEDKVRKLMILYPQIDFQPLLLSFIR